MRRRIIKRTVDDANSYQRANFSFLDGTGNHTTTITFSFNAEKASEAVYQGVRFKILNYDKTELEYMLTENFRDRL